MDDLKQKFDEQIRTLMPISGLAPQYQNEIVTQSQILAIKKKQRVFKQGDVDNYCFYLLDGELELDSNGQLVKKIVGGTVDARNQLAQLQPRQLTAKAKGKVTVLRIDRTLLDRLLTMDDPGMSSGEMEVTEVDAGEDGGGDWMTRMLQSELFSRIPPANIQRVFSVMESVTVAPGEVVVEQDSVGDYYYVIQHGRCEVTRKTESSDRPIKLAELGDGDSFGEEALVSDAKRNATITMLTPGELMRLTKEDFVELIKNPSLSTVAYEQAKVLVSQGARWMDLRFKEEHQVNGIEGSLNIPLNSLRLEMKKLDANQSYIVYCDTSARSSAGAFLLAQNGFDVQLLEGGLFSNPAAAASAAPTEQPAEAPPQPPAAEAKPKAKAPPKPAPKPEAAPPAPAPPPPAAEAPSKSVEADLRAASLSADIAKAETQMEEALRLKAEAEAAKRVAAKKLKSGQAQVGAEAAKASKALEEAKRLRIELVKAKREAEDEAKHLRETEEQRIREMSRKAEERLRAEKAKLEAEYKRQAEELAKIQALKEQTKAELQQEREALERQASLAKEQTEQAERRRDNTEMAEAKLRAETEARIKMERRRLEAEFGRQAEKLAQAQREKEAAAAIRTQAAEQAARIIAEQKNAQVEAQVREEIRLQAERLKLQEEAMKMRKGMEAAKKAKAEAEAAKLQAQVQQEEMIARDIIAANQRAAAKQRAAEDKASAEMASLDAEVNQAKAELKAAEAAHRQVEEAQEDLEDTQRWKKAEIDAMRAQLEAELSEFRDENPTPAENSAEKKKEAAKMAKYKKRREAEEKKRADYNAGLLGDVASQLKRD
jgi:CRP-like cAMP-binding protein